MTVIRETVTADILEEADILKVATAGMAETAIAVIREIVDILKIIADILEIATADIPETAVDIRKGDTRRVSIAPVVTAVNRIRSRNGRKLSINFSRVRARMPTSTSRRANTICSINREIAIIGAGGGEVGRIIIVEVDPTGKLTNLLVYHLP
uniref:Uncharacterized protein n=2 Tax=Photinus pyralis TaxID=7054 RepID=A0A1Y1K7J8_PHOPY